MLYCRGGADIFDSSYGHDLQKMADAIAKLGYAPDAAKEAMDFLLTIRACQNRLEAMRDRLSPIFYAMEWWQSGDSSEEDFKEALGRYRGENPA